VCGWVDEWGTGCGGCFEKDPGGYGIVLPCNNVCMQMIKNSMIKQYAISIHIALNSPLFGQVGKDCYGHFATFENLLPSGEFS